MNNSSTAPIGSLPNLSGLPTPPKFENHVQLLEWAVTPEGIAYFARLDEVLATTAGESGAGVVGIIN